MPIYEYQCGDCQREFELLIRSETDLECPHCQGIHLSKQLSLPAAPATSGKSLPVCNPVPRGGGCGLPQCGSGGCQFE